MILRVLFPNKICQISRSDILFLLTASVAVQTGIPEAILTTYVAVQLHHTTLLAKRDETALTTDVADHRPHTTLLADTDSNSTDNRCGCSTSSHHTATRQTPAALTTDVAVYLHQITKPKAPIHF